MRMMKGTLGIVRMMKMKIVSRMRLSFIAASMAVLLLLTLRNGVVLRSLTHWSVKYDSVIILNTSEWGSVKKLNTLECVDKAASLRQYRFDPLVTLLLHLPMRDCGENLEKTSDTQFYSRQQRTSIRSTSDGSYHLIRLEFSSKQA